MRINIDVEGWNLLPQLTNEFYQSQEALIGDSIRVTLVVVFGILPQNFGDL